MNDTLTTLTSFIMIPVNVKGIEAVIKAWIVNVKVYDILLEVSWMRHVHFNAHYREGTCTITEDDEYTR